jgi:hypothetical protein
LISPKTQSAQSHRTAANICAASHVALLPISPVGLD